MSENSLDKLINTLKSEAIEAADQQALEILDKAKERAKKILKEAEHKSAEILQNAEEEAQATRHKAESALQQAARDLTMSVRQDILKLLGTVLEREVETAFTPNLMGEAILKVVENLGNEVALKLPEKMEKQLTDQIQRSLQTGNLFNSIKGDTNLLNGFSIAKSDEGWSYHISPEEVAELLNSYLSVKWVQMLKNE